MRVGSLANQALSTKQPQLAADCGRTPTVLLARLRWVGIQKLLQIFVAKAGHVELTAADRFQQGTVIRVEGVDGSYPLSFPADRLLNGGGEFFQCAGGVDRRQRTAVSVEGAV